MQATIQYEEKNEDSLESVRALWYKLNALHQGMSPHFKEYYARQDFETRKNLWIDKAQRGCLLVLLAHREAVLVGYCIASLVDSAGEIDSLYVSEDCRRLGIGSTLLEKALSWLDSFAPAKVTIMASLQNETALKFYAEQGFFPRVVELQRPPE